MSVYMIFRFDVTDLDKLRGYGAAVQPLLKRHQAEILVIDLEGKILEGDSQLFTVVLKFASEDLAMAFYDDPDYVPLKLVRAEATDNTSVILCKSFVPPL
ncbi:DUF1330 domain-containing protein [Caulobacter sp. S45]|uniref:DUF1330 domain-containing protein n=1 Tax=Caulobacter sp. S45 TaxID=1641861 RepID=UPI00131E80E6|nr:DUF1330 domain-containing protein [Caulobacter sp. S45]